MKFEWKEKKFILTAENYEKRYKLFFKISTYSWLHAWHECNALNMTLPNFEKQKTLRSSFTLYFEKVWFHTSWTICWIAKLCKFPK